MMYNLVCADTSHGTTDKGAHAAPPTEHAVQSKMASDPPRRRTSPRETALTTLRQWIPIRAPHASPRGSNPGDPRVVCLRQRFANAGTAPIQENRADLLLLARVWIDLDVRAASEETLLDGVIQEGRDL